ncbi:MAG: DUF4332 domain-containing protein [Cyanobacteria bacterium P01_F01_bin.42]
MSVNRDRHSHPLTELPGIPADLLGQLNARGIQTTSQLLQTAADPAHRKKLARSLNLRDQVIGKWYAMAELAQVPNVGTVYCGLLLHCGIHSVRQLASADAGRLHRQVLRFQVALLRNREQCPQLVDVVQWIRQAQRISASAR